MPLLDRMLARFARWHAQATTRRFARAVAAARSTQGRLLELLIGIGRSSDFGRAHGFEVIRNYDDFKRQVPIRPYAGISEYVDRVRRGEVHALFPRGTEILMFALTSGTTAEPKYVPITPRALAESRAGWNIWGLSALLDHPECILRHIVQVTSPMNDHAAPSGVPCGAVTGLLAATQKKLVRRYYTSPLTIAGIADSQAKYYAIMRLAIVKDVAWLVTANPATLLALAKVADRNKESLIRDVHDGTIDGSIPIEPEIRAALRPLLPADPSRARELEAINNRLGALLPKDYWRLGFVAHWTGGTMGLYQSLLPAYFGDIHSRDIGLIASEGRMSIPLADGSAAGVLAVTSQFFEFIPAGEYGSASPTALRCHELEDGGEYFIVLTNFSGLYRYDLGDRVRVVGRQGEAPIIEFLSRDAHTSSMSGEKLTEDQVILAMRGVATDGAAITDFVLAPRFADVPWYRLYVDERHATANLADRFERALCGVSIEYESKRKSLRLGPVEVVALAVETLAQRDREQKARHSRTAEQFKHQYLLPRPGLDADLEQLANQHKK